ncbi:Glycerophosphoryl diester phosphodiesterase [Rubellimicrobium mesophilum DSM 19309]|uniref:Glycerophosphoryl diester phosphodiesterase n=1 Tax=Rubellimicrobium mesophilum DSM 19309 TaxID=442562 RepID=A0A017HV38_9RHOB|nr:glycerophosphodiester phosphodiesterase family protein [Rubellimicrobium mesophilum]EYD78372.1 Glycerophosphoryl diester phosphodiesterase [Rubellimicrobium mesophilum DSM 19309]
MRLPDAFLSRPIAHRALHDRDAGRPENGRAAMRAAIERGYGIECDLQLSADGVAMVFHDDELMRLTGEDGPLRGRTASALGKLKLRHGDEGVPTLREVLDLVAGRVPLLIEVKDQTHRLAPVDGVLEEATARELRGYEGPVALMSFNPHSVIALRDLAPEVPRGLTTCDFDPSDHEWAPAGPERLEHLRRIEDYDAAGACFISHQASDLRRPRVAELKAQGAAVLCWTIRSAEQERLARAVADNVTFEGYLA